MKTLTLKTRVFPAKVFVITVDAIQKGTLLMIALSLLIVPRAVAANDIDRRAAAALFARYETIFYTNTDLSTPLTLYKGLSRSVAGSLAIPFGELPAALDLLNKHASSEILGNADAVLLGAKNFISPRGAGSAGHPGSYCFIVSFGKQSEPSLGKYFTQTPVASVAAGPVWKWVADLYEREPPVTYYATQVGSFYLLFSNDDKELQKVAAELASSNDPPKTLTTVRDWSFVSQHEYWGYRFLRRKGLNGKDLADLDQFLPGAEAIAVFVDIKQKAGVMRLLGSERTKSAVPKVNKSIADETGGSAMSFQPVSDGVWDAPFSLSGRGQDPMAKTWEIMKFFGYPIII
jgi:hypothetical protein